MAHYVEQLFYTNERNIITLTEALKILSNFFFIKTNKSMNKKELRDLLRFQLLQYQHIRTDNARYEILPPNVKYKV